MTGHVFGDLMTSELINDTCKLIFVFKQVQYWMMSEFCYVISLEVINHQIKFLS